MSFCEALATVLLGVSLYFMYKRIVTNPNESGKRGLVVNIPSNDYEMNQAVPYNSDEELDNSVEVEDDGSEGTSEYEEDDEEDDEEDSSEDASEHPDDQAGEESEEEASDPEEVQEEQQGQESVDDSINESVLTAILDNYEVVNNSEDSSE
jgi:hypothetical protein